MLEVPNSNISCLYFFVFIIWVLFVQANFVNIIFINVFFSMSRIKCNFILIEQNIMPNEDDKTANSPINTGPGPVKGNPVPTHPFQGFKA